MQKDKGNNSLNRFLKYNIIYIIFHPSRQHEKNAAHFPLKKKNTTPTVLCAFQKSLPRYHMIAPRRSWNRETPHCNRPERLVVSLFGNWKHVAVGFCWHLFSSHHVFFWLMYGRIMWPKVLCWLVFVCSIFSLLKIWRLSFWNWNTNERSPKCMGETICQKDHLAKRARQPAGRACGWFLAGYPLWKEPIFLRSR